MRRNPKGIRFEDIQKVGAFYLGPPRQQSSSHWVYKMLWSGDPRVNIQNDQGMAKAYQVRQVLRAIDRVEAENNA